MRFTMRLGARAGAMVAVVGVTACGGLSDPSGGAGALGADLALVDSVLDAPLARSAGYFFGGGPLPAPAAGSPLLPDSLLGRTLGYDCGARQYALTGETGAPPDAVRLVLYRLAPDGAVACPETAVGTLDLTDASAGDTSAVHAIAAGPDGSRLLEYTIRHAVADSPGVARAGGFVSDGQRRLDFDLTASAGWASHRRVSWLQLDDAALGLHAALRDSAEMGVDTYTQGVDLALRAAAAAVELAGTTGWFNTRQSWDETLTYNDVPLASVSGSLVPDGGEPTVTALVSRPLTADERQLVSAAIAAPGAISLALSRVLGAGRRLVPINF